LESLVFRVVISNPLKTRAIAEAGVKREKVNPEGVAQLLAADYLPPGVAPRGATHALRRQVARRARILRQRTRQKNQMQSILHRNLAPRCPAADLLDIRAAHGSPSRICPPMSAKPLRRRSVSSTSTATNYG